MNRSTFKWINTTWHTPCRTTTVCTSHNTHYRNKQDHETSESTQTSLVSSITNS